MEYAFLWDMSLKSGFEANHHIDNVIGQNVCVCYFTSTQGMLSVRMLRLTYSEMSQYICDSCAHCSWSGADCGTKISQHGYFFCGTFTG